jgi:hypothetical protein
MKINYTLIHLDLGQVNSAVEICKITRTQPAALGLNSQLDLTSPNSFTIDSRTTARVESQTKCQESMKRN